MDLPMQVHVWRRYSATAGGYDELYGVEQWEKYSASIPLRPPRGRMLDAGCGTGLLVEYMLLHGFLGDVSHYVGLDLTPGMLDLALERLRRLGVPGDLVQGDLEFLPFRDSSFDAVYSYTVLDLLTHPSRGLGELRRVSRGPVVYSLLRKAQKHRLLQPRGRLLASTGKDLIFEAPGEA